MFLLGNSTVNDTLDLLLLLCKLYGIYCDTPVKKNLQQLF